MAQLTAVMVVQVFLFQSLDHLLHMLAVAVAVCITVEQVELQLQAVEQVAALAETELLQLLILAVQVVAVETLVAMEPMVVLA